MAKQAEANATVESVKQDVASAGLAITPEILAMISAAVAAAVKESKRDEKAEAEESRREEDRERVRLEEQARIANIRARQDNCPHLDAYENYAFCGQRSCAGEYIFICSQCVRPFRPSDPDYANYVRYVKWDKMGAARQ